jgi:hypothetical protein
VLPSLQPVCFDRVNVSYTVLFQLIGLDPYLSDELVTIIAACWNYRQFSYEGMAEPGNNGNSNNSGSSNSSKPPGQNRVRFQDTTDEVGNELT